MPNPCGSQALCGPFLSTDLPSFQAAVIHTQTHWQRCLRWAELEVLQFVQNLTVRFGQRETRYPQNWRNFLDGYDANPETGFAGVPGIVTVSRQAVQDAIKCLVSYGILIDNNGRYAVDYSITCADLVEHPSVLRRMMATANNGIFSTVEGIRAWTIKQLSCLRRGQVAVSPSDVAEPAGTPTATTAAEISFAAPRTGPKCLRTLPASSSLLYKNYLFPEYSGNNTRGTFWDFIMGNATAADLKASILAAVGNKRDKLAAKRKQRGNLSDLANGFEREWSSGQLEASGGRIPSSRIASKRDRHLLKEQIIKPFRNTEIDPAHFAYWVTSNWDAIGGNYFRKSKSYPERPAFPWVVACLDRYVEAYTRRDQLDPTQAFSRADIARKHKAYEVASEALQSTAQKLEASTGDLKRQLDEAHKEIDKLRADHGMDEDDDPIFRKVRRIAAKPTKFGKFD